MNKKYWVAVALLSICLTACGSSELNTTSNDGEAVNLEIVQDAVTSEDENQTPEVHYMVNGKEVSEEEYIAAGGVIGSSNDEESDVPKVEYMVNGKPVSKEEYDQSKLETNALSVLSDNGQSLDYDSKEFGENNTVIFHYEDGTTIIVEENGSVSIETPAQSEIPE